MSKARLVADADERVSKAVAECNALAKKLLSEAAPYTKRVAEQVLAADTERMLGAATELYRARQTLAKEVADYQDLTRSL